MKAELVTAASNVVRNPQILVNMARVHIANLENALASDKEMFQRNGDDAGADASAP